LPLVLGWLLRLDLRISARTILHRQLSTRLTAAMDYSASIQDADHPAEASPWGSSPGSSPQHNRPAFGAAVSETPASPSGFGTHTSSNGFRSEQDDEGFGAGDGGYNRRPDTASTVSEAENPAEESRTEEAPSHQPELQQHQAQQPRQPDQQEPVGPAGDHAHRARERRARKPAQQQFKLQAKITGLERTGRKDPILRFDVHVRHMIPPPSR
jgi:hypothetical protein